MMQFIFLVMTGMTIYLIQNCGFHGEKFYYIAWGDSNISHTIKEIVKHTFQSKYIYE